VGEFAELEVGAPGGCAAYGENIGDLLVAQAGFQYALPDHAGGSEDDNAHNDRR
jgi:hypothetical protein